MSQKGKGVRRKRWKEKKEKVSGTFLSALVVKSRKKRSGTFLSALVVKSALNHLQGKGEGKGVKR